MAPFYRHTVARLAVVVPVNVISVLFRMTEIVTINGYAISRIRKPLGEDVPNNFLYKNFVL